MVSGVKGDQNIVFRFNYKRKEEGWRVCYEGSRISYPFTVVGRVVLIKHRVVFSSLEFYIRLGWSILLLQIVLCHKVVLFDSTPKKGAAS